MADVAKEPWYHGSIPRGIAEERLDKSAIGTFLVRESESRPGYSLSIKVPGKIKHYIVSRLPDGSFQIVGKDNIFANMVLLIKFYSSTAPSSSDGVCLGAICPREDEEDKPGSHYVDLVDSGVNKEALREAQALNDAKKKDMQQRAATKEEAKKTPRMSYENVGLPPVPARDHK